MPSNTGPQKSKIDPVTLHRMELAAKRYAAADPSDPFAYARALSHLRHGISSPYTERGETAYYDADQATETRVMPDGTEYLHPIYRNRSRP